MEGREGLGSGVTLLGAEAPSAYHVAPRVENPAQAGGPSSIGAGPPTQVALGMAGAITEKKKRGRPRKYGPDGTVNMASSSRPMSSSAPPPMGGFSSSGKRGKSRAAGSDYKQQKKVGMDFFSGDWNVSSLGTGFMPHIINVNQGEDITMRIISFSQQGPRAICILSASGGISNVTLRQHDSSGGTLTYEGRFEILNLSGAFTPTDVQGTRSRAGGMSISLVSPDGRVVAGIVAGLLIAATPVQLIVGSFLPSNHQEHKPKKPRAESALVPVTPGISISGMSSHNDEEEERMMHGHGHGHGHQNSASQRPNLGSNSPFQRENWPSMNAMQGPRNSATDINISLPGG